jgi:hypothetical protein
MPSRGHALYHNLYDSITIFPLGASSNFKSTISFLVLMERQGCTHSVSVCTHTACIRLLALSLSWCLSPSVSVCLRLSPSVSVCLRLHARMLSVPARRQHAVGRETDRQTETDRQRQHACVQADDVCIRLHGVAGCCLRLSHARMLSLSPLSLSLIVYAHSTSPRQLICSILHISCLTTLCVC